MHGTIPTHADQLRERNELIEKLARQGCRPDSIVQQIEIEFPEHRIGRRRLFDILRRLREAGA